MKNLKNVLNEITALANNIEVNYPELYANLEENKMMIGPPGKQINSDEFAEYLELLKKELKGYIENHKK